MTKALRTSVRSGGLRQGGLQAGLGSDNIFATASLDLNFAVNKNLGTLVDATTGSNLIDFTRASSGTYVGSDGLIKTAVTNLVLQSEAFNVSPWGGNNYTFSSGFLAPNGSASAIKIIRDNTLTSVSNIQQNISPVNVSTDYTYSIYAKAGELSKIGIREGVATGAYFTVNLATGAPIDSSNAASPSISPAGNGWYRISFRITTTAAQTSYGCRIYALPDSYTSGSPSIVNWAGNGSDGLYIWGAQLEQSTTVGEYIPTTSTINSAARFDHDPETGESLGLLVEESRTNLLLQSEEFGAWSSNAGTISPDSATSPNGAVTADKLIATNGGPNGQLFQSLTITSGATVTGSVYVKAGGFDRIELVLLSNNNTTPYGRATFDPNTGTIAIGASTSNGGTNAFASVANVGSGWYRCIVTVTYPAVTNAGIRLNILNSDASNGDGVKGVFLWGAQLEAGSFPTSYIPTEGSTVTRAADVASITGSNFSSWYRQEEGTVFASTVLSVPKKSTTFSAAGSFNDGTINNRMLAVVNSSASDNFYGMFAASAGTTQANANTAIADSVTNANLAIAYKVDSIGYSVDGQNAVVDTSASIPTVDRLEIGNAISRLNGTIRRLTYWPQRLPDSTLQTITQ